MARKTHTPSAQSNKLLNGLEQAKCKGWALPLLEEDRLYLIERLSDFKIQLELGGRFELPSSYATLLPQVRQLELIKKRLDIVVDGLGVKLEEFLKKENDQAVSKQKD